MNGLSLLATNKSVVNVRDHSSPYRISSANRLPNFGVRNPFANTAAADCGASLAPTVRPQIAVVENLPLFGEELKPSAGLIAEAAADGAVEAAVKPAAVSVAPVLRTQDEAAPQAAGAGDTAHTFKALTRERMDVQPRKVTQERSSGGGVISALFAWRRSGRTSEPARRVVQCELSLERVTVKRNPLNEAEVKVVSRQPAPEPARAIATVRMAAGGRKETGGMGTALARFFALGQARGG